MKFEMFAIRKLLSKYVEDYLNSITDIQREREERKFAPITYIDDRLKNLLDIIHTHWVVADGMQWKEAFEKLETNYELVEILNELLFKTPYSEEEINHIFCNRYAVYKNPYLDIAVRRLLFSIYNTNNIEEIFKAFEKEKEYFDNNPYQPFISLLKQKFEDKNDIMTYIYSSFEKWFNKEFNCGGYALEVFDWVLCEDKDKDVMVSKILTNPSVRLLGNTLLQEDEYLVILDATNYHFIKHKDGRFVEKMRSASNWRI